MESKNLKAIQVLAKIGEIASQVIFICCCVGAGFCVAGMIGLAVLPLDGININGVHIAGLIRAEDVANVQTGITFTLIGLVMCAGEAVICKFSRLYFKRERAAGTPFTFEGAKELLRLGIISIAVSIGCTIVSSIIYAIMDYIYQGAIADFSIDDIGNVGIGIVFIILSVIFRYGAEISQNDKLQ